MKRYWGHIVRSTEERVEDFLARQVTDPARRDVGRLESEIIEGKPTVYLLTDCLCLYFCEDSKFYGKGNASRFVMEEDGCEDSPLEENQRKDIPQSRQESLGEKLWNAIELGVRFVERWQREDGSMDFPSCNFYSAPDTAFCFRRLYGGWQILKKYGTTAAENAMADRYLRMLTKCAPILLYGGFHTPNHRWAVTAALLCLARLMEENANDTVTGERPEGAAAPIDSITPEMLRDRAAQYLAEGIDGDEDGEYAERSTGNYNAVVDKSLILIVESLAMKNCAAHNGEAYVLDPLCESGPKVESLAMKNCAAHNGEAYLGYVERNLTAMLYYFDGDDTIFTQNSTRQDRGKKLYPEQYFYLYTYMADKTGSALFDAAAHKMIHDNQSRGEMAPDCMYFFMTHENLLSYAFKGYGYLQEYRKFFRGSEVLRVKKQNYGYSVLNHKAGFLFLKFGDFPIGVRIGEAYCDIRNFIPAQIEVGEDTCTLSASAQGWYYQPFAKDSGTSDWWKMDHGKRERCITSTLDTEVQIRELEDGLEITVKTTGLSGLPLRVEIDIPAGCILENDAIRLHADQGESMIVKQGDLKIVDEATEIRLGPGFGTHFFGGHYSGEIKNTEGYSIFMNDYTPCERTFRITGSCPKNRFEV